LLGRPLRKMRERSLHKVQAAGSDSSIMEVVRTDAGLYLKARTSEVAHIPETHRVILNQAVNAYGMDPRLVEMLENGYYGMSLRTNIPLAEAHARASALLKQCGYSIDTIPVGLGYAPMFNAWCSRSIWSPQIVLNVMLVHFLDAINTISFYASIYSEESSRPNLDPAWRNVALSALDDFADIVGGTQHSWPTMKVHRVLAAGFILSGPDNRWAKLGRSLAETQLCWILLHEAGHVILKHRAVLDEKARLQEFAADAFATKILDGLDWRTAQSFDMVDGASSVPVLCDALALVERKYPRPTRTHPTVRERTEHIRSLTPRWETWGAGASDNVFDLLEK
jgi:hypothetical protein